MPNLPIYEQQVSANIDRPESPAIVGAGDANAFGAAAGSALRSVGDALNMGAETLNSIAEKQRREDAASKTAGFDFTPDELALKNQVPADGSGYHNLVKNTYTQKVNDYANNIDDPQTRDSVRKQLMSQLPTLNARSAEYEFQTGQANGKLNADDALQTLTNRVQQDPYSFDTVVAQGSNVINSRPDIPQSTKAAWSQTWTNDAAKYRMDGALQQAKTIPQLDALATELATHDPNNPQSKDWAALMRPADYHTIIDQIGTARKAMRTKFDSVADAQLSYLGERVKAADGGIPSDELQTGQAAVAATGDGVKQQKIARITRDNTITITNQRLTPADLRGQINAIAGSPGAAYPDLPPDVSTMVNQASTTTGMSAGYLGGLATREYGASFKAAKPAVDQQFAPQVVNQNVDLRNMRPDVVAAATLAGQAIGAPLMITKGQSGNPISTTQGADIDIATVGKSSADKAKMAGALVDAGFTGIADYGSYMRVGMRSAVPADFGDNAQGQTWGGWTMLSPEIADVLKSKGFASGASSDIIKRSGPAATPSIDYTQPTSVVGPDGKPATSALGLTQFTNNTWLGVIKSPGAAQQAGINIDGMSDQQLLDLRKNPKVSLVMAGVYGQQNKQVMQQTLGRPVDDAEVYMAHLFGPSGAITFINGNKNMPTQSAAALMPQAAKANPGVFYQKDGTPVSVADAYNTISNSFNLDPTRVAYEDNEQRKRILENMTTSLAKDPVNYAARVGSFNILPLDAPQGFAERGKTSLAIADYYGQPRETTHPFTEDEANALKKQLDDGGSDQAVKVMGAIASMPDQAAKAALTQLGQKDGTFGYAGRLYLDGNRGVAVDIMKGRQMLTKNPTISKDLGITDDVVNSQFTAATGSAITTLKSDEQDAIRESAKAYWVAKQSGTKQLGTFGSSSSMSFGDAVQAVMGGNKQLPAISSVNSKMTVMPEGLKADEVEKALNRMTIQDYTRLSGDGKAPMYTDGTTPNPEDIGSEAMLLAVGGGKYQVMLDNGTKLLTGDVDGNGRPVAYTIKPDAKEFKAIAARPLPIGAVTRGLKAGMKTVYDAGIAWAAKQ